MRVVNKRTHKPTSFDVYVGRPSALGNPYRAETEDKRDRVIQLYRSWLHQQLMNGNGRVIDALERLDPDANLVCWCAPKACHADVIIRAYDWWFSTRHRP